MANIEDLIIRDTRANQPAASIPGRLYYVTDEGVTERDNGVAWEDVSDSGIGATDHGALTGLGDDDHTQYILAGGSRAFTGDQSMGSHKLTNVTDPASAQDAATKNYVDGIAANLGKRARVRAATTANITISTALNNGDTLDGVTLATGDLVLVKDQTAAAENGVYVVGVSPARAAEFDTYDEHPGSLIAVQEGTANAETLWLCTSNVGGVLDTNDIDFAALATSAAVEDLTTVETDISLSLAPDGLGGVEWVTPSGGGTGATNLLAYKEYSGGDKSITGASMADVDAANLAVIFTAPPSGIVLVRLTATAGPGTTGNAYLSWGLRESTTNIAGGSAGGIVTRESQGAGAEQFQGVTKSFIISGLTPGSVHTYKWSAAMSSGTGSIFANSDTSMIMEVYDMAPQGGGFYDAYLCYIDQKANNTAGGTFTSGAWRTRDLNTERADTAGIGSVASNQITLAAGTYRIHASAPAWQVNRHAARLYDITHSAALLDGSSEYCFADGGGDGSSSPSTINGVITLTEATVIEVQHQCQTTKATSGFGLESGSSFTVGHEVYTIVEIWRLGTASGPRLESISPTTTDVTAVPNTKYVADVSGLTANRNFKLPAGAVGDEIVLNIKTGDDTYALIIIGDTGISINGGATATEWGRASAAGDSIRLVLDTTTNWQVINDGRLHGSLGPLADITGAAGAGVSYEFDAGSSPLTWSTAVDTETVGSTIKSHLYIQDNGASETLGTYSWSPAGAFDIRCKLRMGVESASNNFGCGLIVGDSAMGNRVMITIVNNVNGFYVAGYTYASATYTQRGSNHIIGVNDVYMRIVRDGSNNNSMYWSIDGLVWQLIATQALTYTCGKAGLRLSPNSLITTLAVDWIRSDV